MSSRKKQIRQQFRDEVFGRDKFSCVVCGSPAADAHHITNRNEMPNGGYVKENGASLCAKCHIEAEAELLGLRTVDKKYHPDELYKAIGSSYELALAASKN